MDEEKFERIWETLKRLKKFDFESKETAHAIYNPHTDKVEFVNEENETKKELTKEDFKRVWTNYDEIFHLAFHHKLPPSSDDIFTVWIIRESKKWEARSRLWSKKSN